MLTNQFYLLADIGGTNSNFILYDKVQKKIISRFDFKTEEISNYDNFEFFLNFLITKIINEKKILVENLILAVAGKLNRTRTKISSTNLNLKIESKQILEKTSIKKIKLINDFTAISSAIISSDFLEKNQLKKLNGISLNKLKSVSLSSENIIVIGAGTGLGVSYIKKSKIIESEDGHIDFNLKSKQIMDKNLKKELIKFLKKKLSKKSVVYEDLLSGKGLVNIYNFLEYFEFKKKDNFNKNDKLKNKITPEYISKNKNKNLIAKKTFEIFFKIYAEFIIKLESKFNSNYIFLAGGIIEKNLLLSKLILSEFEDNFIKKKNIYIIKNYDVSINGLIDLVKL